MQTYSRPKLKLKLTKANLNYVDNNEINLLMLPRSCKIIKQS